MAEIMDCQEIEHQGLLKIIAKLFNNEIRAKTLLGKVKFPKDEIPNFDSASSFWQNICEEIENGLIPGGPTVLLRAASDIYAHNEHLAQWRQTASTPENRNHPTVIISVSGFEDSIELFEIARRIASARHIPGEVSLELVR
ncbi:MAG: hypothetical protein GY816_13625, partial [Cytophagales bacterium]|nr:hypothetical protein [Cytophagales bacterium]